MERPGRAGLISLGGLSMLAGLDAALLLLGLPAPVQLDRLAELHGILMVLGFLGTVIALERAVALRRSWGYLAPGGLGGGALLTVTPAPLLLGQLVLLTGTLVLVAVYAALWRRARDPVVLAQLVGAVFAVCAVGLWPRTDVPTVLVLLSCFIVVTIAAERVELARLTLPASAGDVLLVGTTVLGATAATGLIWPAVGGRLFGAALAAVALWLATHDVAVRTIRGRGLPRFAAAAMLAGYGWLLVAACIWVASGAAGTGWAYDTVVHAVFLGFAMSMVMAHAPVILPSVLRVRLPYHRLLWLPLVALHLTLAVRVTGSIGQAPWYQAGAVGTVVAMLLLVLAIVATGRLPDGRLRPRETGTDRPAASAAPIADAAQVQR